MLAQLLIFGLWLMPLIALALRDRSMDGYGTDTWVFGIAAGTYTLATTLFRPALLMNEFFEKDDLSPEQWGSIRLRQAIFCGGVVPAFVVAFVLWG